jgi:hypothetical protein
VRSVSLLDGWEEGKRGGERADFVHDDARVVLLGPYRESIALILLIWIP